jgi:hypothetical protein
MPDALPGLSRLPLTFGARRRLLLIQILRSQWPVKQFHNFQIPLIQFQDAPGFVKIPCQYSDFIYQRTSREMVESPEAKPVFEVFRVFLEFPDFLDLLGGPVGPGVSTSKYADFRFIRRKLGKINLFVVHNRW